jgi:hypothetical protein
MVAHRDWSGVIRDSDQIGRNPTPEPDDEDHIVRGTD